jgi:hypothetical protein
MAVILVVLAKNDARYADGFAAVTTQDAAKMLRGKFCRHERCSLDKFT